MLIWTHTACRNLSFIRIECRRQKEHRHLFEKQVREVVGSPYMAMRSTNMFIIIMQ